MDRVKTSAHRHAPNSQLSSDHTFPGFNGGMNSASWNREQLLGCHNPIKWFAGRSGWR